MCEMTRSRGSDMILTTVPIMDRHLYILFIILSTLFLFNIPRGTVAFHCEPCNRSTCLDPVDCEGGLVVDACGCCKVCAKQGDGECGGLHGLKGRCDQGLYCAIQAEPGLTITGHEDGICKVIPSSPLLLCEHVRCNIVLERLCPPDSISVGGTVPAGECCPEPFHCECMPCLDSGPACGDYQLRLLTKLGIGQPDQCCDTYQCLDKGDICDDIVCELDPFMNATCPEDSVPLSPLITQNGCCTQHAGCICAPPDLCHIPHCDPGTRPQLVAPHTGQPGRCCDIIQCVSDTVAQCPTSTGVWREDGEVWMLDECTQCECYGGLTQCSKVQCPLIEYCGWMNTPPGECCHQCMGCTKGNMTYHNDDEWQQDDCVTCYCEDGQVYCRAELCLVHCANPRTIPGRCCPICDDDTSTFMLPSDCPDLDNCTMAPFCPLGLEEDEEGCYLCACKDDVIIGALPERCGLDCPHGYALDQDGILMCQCVTPPPSTTTTSTTLTPPSHWEAPSSPPSTPDVITPPDGSVEPGGRDLIDIFTCPSMRTCEKECAFGYRVSKEGCPKCKCNRCPPFICQKKCVHGYAYNDNHCVLCKCKDNKTQLPEDDLLTTSEPPVLVTDGQTCLTDDGRLWEEGQSWHDGCRLCFCHNAKEMCTLITCPVPRCRHPLVRPGDCCSSCPDETSLDLPAKATSCQADGGQHIAEGETWRMDQCSLCICHNGDMLCEAERCPPLTCHKPVHLTHHCCPICLEDDLPPATLPNNTPGGLCQVSPGMIFHSGDIWRVSACQSCICRDGQIHCFSQTCPLLTKCNKTIMRKGQCCPQCIEEEPGPMTCTLAGEKYASREMWLLNNCTWCICREGRILCLDTQCSPLTCAASDTCCHICTNLTSGTPELEGHSPSEDGSVVYLTLIIVLVLAVLILIIIVALLCWRWKRHKKRERDRHAKAMQAMFQREPGHIDLNKRPKSVNLEYRGGNPLDRIHYKLPVINKFSLYDETEVLLAAKAKCLEVDSVVPRPGLTDSIRAEKDGLLTSAPTNNLNEYRSATTQDNYNINCGSEHTLTKPYTNSSNDLTCDMDKLSEFDNAACLGSSCSDFDVNKSGRPPSTCSRFSDDDSPMCAKSEDTEQCPNVNSDTCNVLDRDTTRDSTHVPIITNIPNRDLPPHDKQMRYSMNDDVWLRNSSKQSDKAPMGDKYIRYSVGAENTSTGPDVHLGLPPVCDSASYRKSL